MTIKKTDKKDQARESAFKVFKSAVKNIEAYKKFLKQYKLSSEKIIKKKDFEAIPITNKSNYLEAFKLKELVPFGKIPQMISASSGSSGKPYYWPRNKEQELRGAKLHKEIIYDIFGLKKKKTLVIVCFSMGNWIAGTFSLASLREIAEEKNSNLSIVTPGIDKEDALSTLRDLANQFESVVLMGYPPFLMDVVLKAKEMKINLKKLNLHFIFAGENFSEKWRDIIKVNAGIPKKAMNKTVSIYGTADAGSIGLENPFTIFIRRLANKYKDFSKDLYGDVSYTPTTISYSPNDFYFESINSELVFTANSGIPLIRYNIKDHGMILSYNYIMSLVKKHNLIKHIPTNVKKWKNPIIVLKGRIDVSVTFYALNIYPENIKTGLEDDKVLDFVTGKYVITTEQSEDYTEQKLKIEVEIKKGVRVSNKIKKIIESSIFDNLIKLNTEYRKLFHSIHEKALPEIILVKNGHEQFIIKKAKHNWINKTQ
ncbi:MAG: hypothetical protein U9R00_01200 [Patescibacteria group bacterium]|nr:hypothetical protein [Patescibacteria group bacterium]